MICFLLLCPHMSYVISMAQKFCLHANKLLWNETNNSPWGDLGLMIDSLHGLARYNGPLIMSLFHCWHHSAVWSQEMLKFHSKRKKKRKFSGNQVSAKESPHKCRIYFSWQTRQNQRCHFRASYKVQEWKTVLFWYQGWWIRTVTLKKSVTGDKHLLLGILLKILNVNCY